MSKKIICPRCGFDKIDPEDVFCSDCGHNLRIHSQMAPNQPEISEAINFQSTQLNITEGMVKTFHRLDSRYNELDRVDIEHEQQQHYVQHLQQQIQQKNTEVQEKKRITQQEFRDVEKLNKFTWTSVKANLSGNKDELLAKEEKEYFQALNQEQVATNELDELETRLKSATTQLKNLQELKQERDQLQISITKLLDQACEGVPDPIEDQIEAELAQLFSQRDPLLRAKTQYTNAMGHYQNGMHHLNRALERLGSAKGFSDWDTFFGGGLIVDSMKRSRITEAQRAVQNAFQSFNAAYSITPNVPRVPMPQIWKGSGFFDMFFDNIFTDMHVRERIRESAHHVESALHQAQQGKNWIDQNLQGLHHKFSGLENQIKITRAKLTEERRRMLLDAIK